jgi:hypothetical protein
MELRGAKHLGLIMPRKWSFVSNSRIFLINESGSLLPSFKKKI